jgi:hypothetical protein
MDLTVSYTIFLMSIVKMDQCLMLLLSIEDLTGLKPTANYCVVLML